MGRLTRYLIINVKNMRRLDVMDLIAFILVIVGVVGLGLVSPKKVLSALDMEAVPTNLIKGSTTAIYYHALDGKRYVFPDENTYFSWYWYAKFLGIKEISDAELAQIPLGGIVTYRPGTLIKIKSDPKVYVVTQGGVLRWIKDENIAKSMCGIYWEGQVYDISDAFFINYKIGADIQAASDFNILLERSKVITIDIDKGLSL